MLAFFVQIAYLFQNNNSHLATAGYPVVNMPSNKQELTADKRKQIVSQLMLLVKEDTLPE
jgi:hypothetical protein